MPSGSWIGVLGQHVVELAFSNAKDSTLHFRCWTDHRPNEVLRMLNSYFCTAPLMENLWKYC